MSKLIALVGLAVIPFIAIAGHDLRELQLVLAMGIALSSALVWIKQKGLGRVSNTPALLFLGYIWLSTMLAPKPGLSIGGMDLGYFWSWKPLYMISVMFLFMSSVASWRISGRTLEKIFNIISWSGIVMSIFVYLQAMGLDQFFVADPTAMPHDQWNLAGTLGHPSFVATWLAITAPFALAYKSKIKFIIICGAVCLTMSMIGIGSLIAGFAVYWGVKSSRRTRLVLLWATLIAVFALSAWVNVPSTHKHLTASGRISQWVQVVKDINTPLPGTNVKYPITGRGLGSFYYVYHTEHSTPERPNRFFQAHNEYLELLWNTGITGLAIFLCAMFTVWKQNFSIKEALRGTANKYRMALLASFLCISLCAGGTFVWQIGTLIYYTIIVTGLLTNTSEV